MNTRSHRVLLAASGLTLAIGSAFVLTRAGAQKDPNKPMAQISPLAAIKTATKAVPGRALMANFEYDEGHWIYGVMILTPEKKLMEVEVDPMTGKIAGKPEAVTPEDEAKELTDQLNTALGKTSATPAKEADEKDEKAEKN